MTNAAPAEAPSRAERAALLFASPSAVLVIVPAMVIAAGIVVLLLGRHATRDTAETMARHQLVAQAKDVQRDVTFALDQAEPLLAGLRALADPSLSTKEAVIRLHDLVVGRAGLANASIAFPNGSAWSTYIDRTTGALAIHESKLTDQGTVGTNWGLRGAEPYVIDSETKSYDPRTRPHYTIAAEAKHRVWMPPHVFSTSHKTGLTVTEPVYAGDTLEAVVNLDFNVDELSAFIRQPPLEGAHTVMFTGDGTILAYPAVPIPDTAIAQARLLRHEDFHEPALEALFAALGTATPSEQRFLELHASTGDYLASIARLDGTLGGTSTPLGWYLATFVPDSTLYGATRRLGRQAILASAGALALAFGVALLFAWNVLRMRRAVVSARAQAKSAEERAKQLGSYRLVERLGAGGMGEVWRAEHQLLAKQAAIKLVRPEVLGDPAHADLIRVRFRREAQTLASMRSRHTIALYDYGVTEDGRFFYVMELLDGLDLSDLVKDHGAQPAARVIGILHQACQSLAEAHDAGLLHRDIKPANLMLSRAADEVDIVKLLDFGIVHNVSDPVEAHAPAMPQAAKPTAPTPPPASTSERLTLEGVVIGTPGYIPPEQAVGEPLDPRGDLYALGCVAWFLLTGREVYVRPSEEDVMYAHVNDPLPDLAERVRGWLPTELAQLVTACLAKLPSDRPPHPRVLAEALAAIEIPAEHAWTQAKATSWWRSLTVSDKAAPEDKTAANPQVISPQRGEEPPSPKSAPEAMTIEARPSGRIASE